MRDPNQEADDRLNNYVNCSISQWGVGAKTAGFYLGTSIKVITCPGDELVYEVNLSEKEMIERYNKTGNAFETDMKVRARGNLNESMFVQEGLENEHIFKVLDEERRADRRHFSHFLITTDTPSSFLQGSVRGWWEGSDERRDTAPGSFMTFPLADVYYRMLHGPYGELNDTLNKQAKWMCPLIRLKYVSQREPTKGWEVADLRDVRGNPQSEYMVKHSGNIFRCEVEFTPTQPDNDVGAGEKCVARVEVLYYNKKWERETHPALVEAARLEEVRLEEKEQERKEHERQEQDRRRRPAAREGGLLQPSQVQEVSLSPDDDLDSQVLDKVKKLRSGANVGSQFWNGRLIPEAQDKLPYFMDISYPTELKEALSRVHFMIFFCYPILTDSVKLCFRQNIVADWLNRPDNPSGGWIKAENTVDNRTGQSKSCTRRSRLRELFRQQLKEWVELDENYMFDERDFIDKLSRDEGKVHITKVRLSHDKWVKQGDLVIINGRGSQVTFLRVLCIRLTIDTTEYLDRQMRDMGSQGHVIGYIEPREVENTPALPANAPAVFDHDRSIQQLLRADPIKVRPVLDLKLAPSRLRMFPLRQVDKQVSATDLQRQYQRVVQKAAETYPTRMALYAVTPTWREVKSGEELQLRVKDCFPGSSVITLTAAEPDDEGHPVPVAGEKVLQSTYKVMDVRSSAQRAGRLNMESEHKEDRRPSANTSNPRAGQLAQRRRIPRKDAIQERKEESEDEEKQSPPDPVYTSSGRHSKPPRDLMAEVQERSSKRRGEGAGGGQRKRRKADSPNSPAGGSGEAEHKEEDVEAEVAEVAPSRTLVEMGEWKAEVCSTQHAMALLRGTLDRSNKTVLVHGFEEKRFHELGLHQVEYKLVEKHLVGDRDHVLPITVNVRVYPGAPTFAHLAASHPLSLRLGQRSTEGVRLALDDKWRNSITPSTMRGWKGADLCTLRFWCEEHPQLRVSADKDTLMPHAATDQYQIVGLKVEPREESDGDQAMLDFSGAEQGLLLTCCIELSVPTQSAEEEKAESRKLEIRQKFRLFPGEPQQLKDDFPTELTLTNNDPFPDFTLQYIDAFGKQATFTDEDEVPRVSMWCEDKCMEEWVVDKIAAQPMQNNGAFQSTALHLPPVFVLPRALANIMTTNRDREVSGGVPENEQSPGEHTFVLHLQVAVGSEVKLHKTCSVLLLARAGPSFLLLTQSEKDEPSMDDKLEMGVKPGDDISLFVRTIDDAGFVLSLQRQSNMPESGWREHLSPVIRKAVRITVSGLVDLTGGPFQCGLNDLHETGLVQYIKMPRRVEGRRLQCEVRVEFDEARLSEGEVDRMTAEQKEYYEDDLHFVRTRLPLTCSFVVNVQQLKPSKWSATVPLALGCGDPWRDQVVLRAVDRYGNAVSIPTTMPRPRIQVMAVAERDGAADDSKEEEPGQASIESAGSAMQVDSAAQQQSAVGGSQENVSEDSWQRVRVENAEPVGVPEGDDDVVFDDEYSHFVLERARVIMQVGTAALTVFDDEKALQSSDEVRFTVVPGEPKGVRVWLQCNETGERMRLGNPKPRRLPPSDSDMTVERREGEVVEDASGRLVLPVRIKFDQLAMSWLDRGKNVVTPNTHCRTHLTLRIDNGAIFELPDGGALQSGQVHAFHVTALPELHKDELQRDVQLFPPFVCIYSAGVADEVQRRVEEMKNEESDLHEKRLRLRVEVGGESAAQPSRTLASIEFGLCMLPFSLTGIVCKSMFSEALAHDRELNLEQYRSLLNPAVLSNIKLEDGPDSVPLIMAGALAPTLHIRLPQQENRSSLRYTLPPPDPSSLSVEWAYNQQRCLLRYHPAVVEDGEYIFRPVVEERKEGEQAAVVAQGEVVVAVGQFGRMDKGGKWSYCVTYTEQRPRLTDVLTDKVVTIRADEEVLPSIPHALHVQRNNESSASMPIASNSQSGSRIIAHDLRLLIVDEYGGGVPFTLMSDALRQALRNSTCIVEPVADSADGEEQAAAQPCRAPPQIHVEGAVLNTELHCAVISSISVVNSADGSDAASGQYNLVFSLPAPFTSQFHCSLRFFFSNEQQMLEERRVEEQRRSDRRRQLAALLTEARTEVAAVQAELVQTGQCVNSLRSWQRTICADEDSVLVCLHDLARQATGQQSINVDLDFLQQRVRTWRAEDVSSSSSSPHPFLELDQQLLAALNSLGGRCLSIPAMLYDQRLAGLVMKAPNTPLNRVQDGFYGMLASFCTVADASLCQLISSHFGQFKFFLVQNKESNAKRVLEVNARHYSSSYLTIKYVDNLPAQQQRPVLPHLRLPAPVQQSVTGRPSYVFDCLHFHEPDPQLRQLHQHIIQDVVKNTMIINSMEDAAHYRRLLVQHRIPTPTLLALHEMKALYADNTERVGNRAAAPPLKDVIPRLGVQSVAVKRLIDDVQAVRLKVLAVTKETADLRQRWVANSWVEKEARLRQQFGAAEDKRKQLESELKMLAEQVGQSAVVAPPAHVLLTSGAGGNRQRRRQHG